MNKPKTSRCLVFTVAKIKIALFQTSAIFFTFILLVKCGWNFLELNPRRQYLSLEKENVCVVFNYRKIPKISPGAYIGPFWGAYFLRGLHWKRLMYGGKCAFKNRLGLYLEGKFRLKIDWASCWKEMSSIICRKFTETHLEDVDLSKTQPRKCFVMHGPRKSSDKQRRFLTAIIWHKRQLFGRYKNLYVTVPLLLCFSLFLRVVFSSWMT